MPRGQHCDTEQTNQAGPTDEPARRSESPSHQPRKGRKTLGKDGRGRNRSRASLACLNCRERKIKCTRDAEDPDSCTSCRALHLTCATSHLGDRRRIHSREQIAHLQERVHLLETLLAGQGPRLESHPDINAQHEATDVDHSLELPDAPPEIQAASAHPPAAASSDTNPDAPASLQDRRPSLPSPLLPREIPRNIISPVHHQDHGNYYPPPSNSATLDNGNGVAQPQGEAAIGLGLGSLEEQRANSVPYLGNTQLASVNGPRETGHLAVNSGNCRPCFYGPTSQLHVRSSASPPTSGSGSSDTRDSIVRLDSNRVREVLIQSFWESQPLSTAIVERPRFERGREQARGNVPRSEYWSQFLENALLACASRMRTSADMRALGARYCELATSDIVEELQSPQIATIQGFLLLSDFEATRGKDRLGYQYCGIACRMIFDLGLHESCASLIPQGRLTNADEVSRCLLFLGAYVYDALWGLYLGRPSMIPNSSLQATHGRLESVGGSSPNLLSAWVGLCTEISEVTRILNNNSVPLDSTAVRQLADLDTRVSKRSESLSSTVTFNADQISELAVNAFGLHVQLRGIRIVLHKRLSQTLLANGNDALSPSGQSLERSRDIMYESAVLITRLTSTYVRIFGVENVITVMLDNMFVAAVTLIEHMLRLTQHGGGGNGLSVDTDASNLHSLSDVFHNAQKHYPVTARMLSALSGLVQGSFMAGIFNRATSNHDPDAFRRSSNMDEPLRQLDKRPARDCGGQMGWSMDLGYGTDQQMLAQQPPNWFLHGLGDASTALGAPDMDPDNAMGWLLSPMECVGD